MPVYVAEIAGRAIVAFEAEDEAAARARLADRTFRRDLYVFRSGDRALWDGASEIRLRPALPTEIEIWQAKRAPAGRAEDLGRYQRAFLIPVINPIKYEDDD